MNHMFKLVRMRVPVPCALAGLLTQIMILTLQFLQEFFFLDESLFCAKAKNSYSVCKIHYM